MPLFRILAHQFRRHWVWLKWVLAAAILIWLYQQNREQLAKIDWGDLRWGMVAGGVVICFMAFLLTFVRWYYLVRAQDLPFRLSDAVRLGFIGILFNYVAPGAAGGDIVKALLIAKEQPQRKAVAVTTVLLDRIVGLIALFAVGALASLSFFPLPANAQIRSIATVLWFGTGAGIVGLFLILHTPVPRARWVPLLFRIPVAGKILQEVHEGILLYQARARVLWLSVLLSMVGHLGFLAVFYLGAQSISISEASPTFAGHLFLIPSAELVGVMVFFLPGGIGALEGAVQYMFVLWEQLVQAGIDRDVAEAAGLMTALMFRAINLVVAVVGAGYYIASRKEIEEVLEEEEHVLDEDGPTTDPERLDDAPTG